MLAPGTGRRWCTFSTPGRDAAASDFAFGAAFLEAALAGAFFSAAGLSALAEAAFAGAFLAAVALAVVDLGALASASTASFF